MEGQSDRTTLERGIRRSLSFHYPGKDVSCDVIHGDVIVFEKSMDGVCMGGRSQESNWK